MKFSKLQNAQNILLYGYGVEGKSTEKFLQSHFPNTKVFIHDDSINPSKLNFLDYDVIIRSPGIPREKITGVSKEKITSQTELFFGNLNAEERQKIIGITGTKGKSTTTQFCSDLLSNAHKRVKIAGNFGVPPLDLWDELVVKKIDFIVFELSSFQLEGLEQSPHIAIFLNLFNDHIDRHGTLENYFLSKANIFRYQTEEDFLVMPEVSGKLLEFSRGKGRFVLAGELEESLFPKNSVFRALHFRQNLGTMSTLCHIFKIHSDVLEKTAQEFKGLPHRMEFFAEKNGIRFVNDAIAVNPTASIAAVRFFGKALGSIILGGKPSGDSWEELLTLLRDETEAYILLPSGESKEAILDASNTISFPAERILQADTFEEIVTLAKDKTPQGTICLLSPGAKSFDRFKNYREKGETFKKLVLS